MKSQLIAIVTAVLVVGCGKSQPPEPPDISIHDAVGTGNIEAVKQHLAAGTDVNAWDDSGWTPLLWAALNGHKKIVELLIDAGADVNANNKFDSTPLDWAITSKQTEIADLLRKHGGKTKKELEAEGK